MYYLKMIVKKHICSYRKHKIEKVEEFGSDNSNCTFYVIRRKDKNVGLFSLYIVFLGEINYAIERGYIPIIDMKNYKNIYMEENEFEKVNSWEKFFLQPCENTSLTEVYHSKHVILNDGEFFAYRPNDNLKCLNNKKIMKKWRQVALKYMHINENVKRIIEEKYESLFPMHERYVGVLARGTDYLKLKPHGHPKQPDPNDLLEECKRVMKKYDCKKVFLATEDIAIKQLFENDLEDKLCTLNSIYVDYKDGYIGNISSKHENEKMIKGEEYLASIVLLSRACCFIGGRTSGTVAAMIFNDNYEYKHIWDLGLY